MKITRHLNIEGHYFYINEIDSLEESEDRQITVSIITFTSKNKEVLLSDLKKNLKTLSIQERKFNSDPQCGWLSIDGLLFYLLLDPKVSSITNDSGNVVITFNFSRLVKTDNLEATLRDLKLEQLIS